MAIRLQKGRMTSRLIFLIMDDDMSISATEVSRPQLKSKERHRLSYGRSEHREPAPTQPGAKKRHILSDLFNQNFLYILATASSLLAGINYIFNYYSVW